MPARGVASSDRARSERLCLENVRCRELLVQVPIASGKETVARLPGESAVSSHSTLKPPLTARAVVRKERQPEATLYSGPQGTTASVPL
jgi:hypothetical protein